jgi:hypothetical protein
MASAAVAGAKRSFATMSNDSTVAMYTTQDADQEVLVSHLRTGTGGEVTRNSSCVLLCSYLTDHSLENLKRLYHSSRYACTSSTE